MSPDTPGTDTPAPLEDGLEDGLAEAFSKDAVRPPPMSVLAALQSRSQSSLGVHIDSPGPGDVPVRVTDATKALRDPNGRYQVLGEIARGGMGVVYKGRDADLGRDVAMKVLHEKFEGNAEVLERFVEEAQIGGQLQHPGIVPVYELGLDKAQRPYFSMKLVKGETLAAQLARRSDPSADRRRFLGVFEQICQTMAYAHVRHVVHRDLKPANVMIGSFGEVQVVDWGFAKVLSTGGVADEKAAKVREGSAQSIIETVRSDASSGTHSVMGSMLGTPGYMPPEQATGDVDRMDERSDVFGLGAILCEILTGQPPYIEDEGDPPVGNLVQQAARGDTSKAIARIEASGANASVIALCKQCLSPARMARPASAQEVSSEVSAYLSSVEERARTAEIHAAESRVRARSTLILSAVAILILAVGGGSYYWLESEAAARRTHAEGLVATAMQKASARHGEATASGFADLTPWTNVQSAAEEVARLAASEFVGEELKAKVADFVRSTRQDHDKATAVAAQNEKDRVMRQALLEVRIPLDEDVTTNSFGRKDPQRIYREYTAAFRTYLDGRKLQDLSVEDAAAALRGSALSAELAAAFDHWWLTRLSAETPGDLNTRLRQLTRRLDPDDVWRNQLRDLLPKAKERKAELVELAKTADFEKLPTLSLVLLAEALWEAEAKTEAVAVYQRAHLLHPADFGLCLGLALMQRKMKDTAAAIASYRIAVALRPDMLKVWIGLGWSLFDENDPDAVAVGRSAVAIDPSSALAHVLLGSVLGKQGKLDESIVSLRRALAIDPKFAHAHSNLGSSLGKQRKLDEAISSYRRALAIDPKREPTHRNLGVALQEQGKLDEAIASYRRALAIDPKHALAHRFLGSALAEQHKLDEAIASYRRALAIDPKNAEGHFVLGNALVRRGKYGEAIASYRRALAIDPKDALAHNGIGIALSKLGKLDESIASYRRALAIDPKHALAHRFLGSALAEQHKLDEAIASYRRALAIDPKHANAHVELAGLLWGEDKPDEAIASFRRGLAVNPKDARAHYGLGALLERQGKLDEAIASFRRSVAIWSRKGDASSKRKAAAAQSEIERLSERLRRRSSLLAIARGKATAVSAEEWVAAADAAYRQGEHVAAVRTFTEAFAAHEKLLGIYPHRYNAACSAVLAAAGQAKDGKDLAQADRTKLRTQAHAWLVAELEQENRNVNTGKDVAKLIPRVQHWQKDPDFVAVRDAKKLASLPADEGKLWRKLWQDVQATLDRAEKKR